MSLPQYLQQHINRAERRLAQMSGRTIPSDAELRAKLHKRMFITGNSPVRPGRLAGNKSLSKRYNPATSMLGAFREKVSQLTSAQAKQAINAPELVANGSAGNLTSQVSSIDIQAAISGGLTIANTPTTADSLGLSIEAADTGC